MGIKEKPPGWRRVFGAALWIWVWAGAGGWPWATAAGAEPAGDFDYHVLALSWNASWCRAEGDARGADQCDPRHDHGFLVHGLWPQREADWPEYCSTRARDPSRAETGAMADLFGSGGLAWHQWKKHGRCTGLSAQAYFRLVREAHSRIRRPALLREIETPMRVDPDVVESAFLEANPALSPESVTVTCAGGLMREVRICLTRDLEPRACSESALRDCRAGAVLLPPMR